LWLVGMRRLTARDAFGVSTSREKLVVEGKADNRFSVGEGSSLGAKFPESFRDLQNVRRRAEAHLVI
jgi:hypothetical protein